MSDEVFTLRFRDFPKFEAKIIEAMEQTVSGYFNHETYLKIVDDLLAGEHCLSLDGGNLFFPTAADMIAFKLKWS